MYKRQVQSVAAAVVPAAGRDAGCGYHGGGNGLDSSYAFGGPGKLVPGGGGAISGPHLAVRKI